MLYQNADTESLFILLLLIIAVSLFALMLALVFVIRRSHTETPGNPAEDARGKTGSLTKWYARLLPDLSPAVRQVLRGLARRGLGGIPSTALLMALFILVLVPGYIWLITRSEQNGIFFRWRLDELWLPCLTFLGTALGGALGVRIAHVGWRQVILGSLLAGTILMILAGSLARLFVVSPWGIEVSGISGLPIALFFLLVIAAGVFLLPLFDPAVRRSGPAPSSWKLVSAALLLSLFLRSAGAVDFYSFGSVIVLGILPALVIVTALILSLSGQAELGARLGGLAVLVLLCLLVFWLLSTLTAAAIGVGMVLLLLLVAGLVWPRLINRSKGEGEATTFAGFNLISSKNTLRAAAGVALTAALMDGIVLALVSVYLRSRTVPPTDHELWLLPLVIIGTGLCGAIGVRAARLSWKQSLLAALVAAAGLMLFARFGYSRPWEIGIRVGQSPFYWISHLQPWGFNAFLMLLVLLSPGLFLLPWLDPLVRRAGPAPSRYTMLLAFLVPVLLAIFGSGPIVYTGLFFHRILPVWMILFALMLSLNKRTVASALLGGMAALVPLLLFGWSLIRSLFG